VFPVRTDEVDGDEGELNDLLRWRPDVEALALAPTRAGEWDRFEWKGARPHPAGSADTSPILAPRERRLPQGDRADEKLRLRFLPKDVVFGGAGAI
jgi:hypothetical protein